jgi:hypothetical protein
MRLVGELAGTAARPFPALDAVGDHTTVVGPACGRCAGMGVS